jgi:hypothetical protein
VYCGGQKAGALDQAWFAVLPAPDMLQVGNGLPRERSRKSCLTGGTHWGMARQLGAARHSSTRQPSTARAGVGASAISAASQKPAACITVERDTFALLALPRLAWGFEGSTFNRLYMVSVHDR